MPDPADRGANLLQQAADLLSRSGRSGTVRVVGQSMLPTLHAGQVLAVDFSPLRLQRGDVLLFRQGDCLLVHRLLGRARARPTDPAERLRTRGDGVIALDPPLGADGVLGRVVAVSSGDRWRSLRGPLGRCYAWCVARHALFWSAVAAAAHVADVRLGRRVFQAAVAFADRALLRAAHALLFRLAHPRSSGPAPGSD